MVLRSQSLATKKKRPLDLPDFERPPLVEVVLGVQFSELTGYRTFHAGLLWDSAFRAEFKKCVERPPLDRVFETFGSAKPAQPRLQLLSVPGPPVPRLWFINPDETELIQVQADRFLHNWRRRQDNPDYPRYEPIRQRFFNELTELKAFVEKEEIGSIEPNQCEITYVNHIEISDDMSPSSQLHRIFDFWDLFGSDSDRSGGLLPEFEDGRFSLRFVITDPKSTDPRGRLHIAAEPAIGPDDRSILRLNLTARGSPSSPTFEAVADFLDLGRDAIVRAFTAITTAEMHELWRRIK